MQPRCLALLDGIEPLDARLQPLLALVLAAVVLQDTADPGVQLLPSDIALLAHRRIDAGHLFFHLRPVDGGFRSSFGLGGRLATGVPATGRGDGMAAGPHDHTPGGEEAVQAGFQVPVHHDAAPKDKGQAAPLGRALFVQRKLVPLEQVLVRVKAGLAIPAIDGSARLALVPDHETPNGPALVLGHAGQIGIEW